MCTRKHKKPPPLPFDAPAIGMTDKEKQEAIRKAEARNHSMLEAAKPLIKWMNENCHPHCTAHVDQTGVELTEGVATAQTAEFLRDRLPGSRA